MALDYWVLSAHSDTRASAVCLGNQIGRELFGGPFHRAIAQSIGNKTRSWSGRRVHCRLSPVLSGSGSSWSKPGLTTDYLVILRSPQCIKVFNAHKEHFELLSFGALALDVLPIDAIILANLVQRLHLIRPMMSLLIGRRWRHNCAECMLWHVFSLYSIISSFPTRFFGISKMHKNIWCSIGENERKWRI